MFYRWVFWQVESYEKDDIYATYIRQLLRVCKNKVMRQVFKTHLFNHLYSYQLNGGI